MCKLVSRRGRTRHVAAMFFIAPQKTHTSATDWPKALNGSLRFEPFLICFACFSILFRSEEIEWRLADSAKPHDVSNLFLYISGVPSGNRAKTGLGSFCLLKQFPLLVHRSWVVTSQCFNSCFSRKPFGKIKCQISGFPKRQLASGL